MQRTILRAFSMIFLLVCLLAGLATASDERLEKGAALFKQRANVALFGQAMYEYEVHYAKNKPDYDKAMFLVQGFYYLGERYGKNNPKKSVSAYNLCVKWAQYALEQKPGDYDASFYEILGKHRAGILGVEIKADEEYKLAKERLEKLIEQHPDKPLALRALGQLYRIAKDWPVGYRDNAQSLKYLQKAYTLAPNDPETAFEYAQSLVANKNYTEARKLLISFDSIKGDPNWQVETDGFRQEAQKLLVSIRGKL